MRLCIHTNEQILSNRPNDRFPAACAFKRSSMLMIQREDLYVVRACVSKREHVRDRKHCSYF